MLLKLALNLIGGRWVSKVYDVSKIAPNTDRNSLCDQTLNRYRDYMRRFNPEAKENNLNERDFLQALDIMKGEHCTYAGLLLLGKRKTIETHFPNYRIDYLEVFGKTNEDAEQCYTYRIEKQENLWEYYFACFERLKQKVDVEFKLTSEGFGVEVSPARESLKEALVNLLTHSDYSSGKVPRIRIFTDQIEFWNPGALPISLNELKMGKISQPRNPVLAKLFGKAGLATNNGSGLEMMDANWNLYRGWNPEFNIQPDSVGLSFDLTPGSENVKQLVSILRPKPGSK
jgi:predicted HTH transcriptional regulator